jgi:hypothetical protein
MPGDQDEPELPPFGLAESLEEAAEERAVEPIAGEAATRAGVTRATGGLGAPEGPDGEHPVVHAIAALRQQLDHLERAVGPEVRAAWGEEGRLATNAGARFRPTWQRAHEGEDRLPVGLVIVAAIGLQVALPSHLMFKPRWLLPALEGALLLAMVIANPRRINRTSTLLRSASIGLIALITLANGWSSGQLVYGLVQGTEGQAAAPLLISGASIYLTNIIVFALWYWDWDRGGPVARAQAVRQYPDFLFAQMTQNHLAPPDWVPTFLDYFYLSFTNATAFSPTDTLPLARWAKMLMLLQSSVALTTVALVVSRAVNILK